MRLCMLKVSARVKVIISHTVFSFCFFVFVFCFAVGVFAFFFFFFCYVHTAGEPSSFDQKEEALAALRESQEGQLLPFQDKPSLDNFLANPTDGYEGKCCCFRLRECLTTKIWKRFPWQETVGKERANPLPLPGWNRKPSKHWQWEGNAWADSCGMLPLYPNLSFKLLALFISSCCPTHGSNAVAIRSTLLWIKFRSVRISVASCFTLFAAFCLNSMETIVCASTVCFLCVPRFWYFFFQFND